MNMIEINLTVAAGNNVKKTLHFQAFKHSYFPIHICFS